MDRSKITAIVTGAISLVLAIVYLMLVQLLDLRGEMIPAPIGDVPAPSAEDRASVSLAPIAPVPVVAIVLSAPIAPSALPAPCLDS